jgi:hypothetical protein
MTLVEIIKKCKINFEKCVVGFDAGTAIDYEYEISPRDFLKYSREDFKSTDERGKINALSNAKRAVDCQIDKILSCMGVDPKKDDKALWTIIENFTSKSSNSPSNKNLPVKLKFLESMNFAPAEIIESARSTRHLLEHEYKNPTGSEVKKAIELAKLFIDATDSKLKNVWNFIITDKEKFNSTNNRPSGGMYISYDEKKHVFRVEDSTSKEKIIKNNDIGFFYLFKLTVSIDDEDNVRETIIDLVKLIDYPMPIAKIKTSIEAL